MATPCAGCGEAVQSQDILHAFGTIYHNYCLICNVCQKDFSDGGALREGPDGYAYCEKDYLKTFADKCGKCQEYIFGQFIEALGKKWHPDHFVCAVCQKDVTKQFYPSPKEPLPLCETHFYSESGLICKGCDNPIMTAKAVDIANHGKYHPEHFNCGYCATNLVGKAFKIHKDKPYCTKCFNNLFG